jgi:prepilin-type N-terminal cleavage/methylation domain-containing protein
VRPVQPRRAFSLVELMVVVAIIAVLVGLLLVALAKVRVSANVSKTQNTMRDFSAACDQFQQEYGRYPGVVPETALAAFGGGPTPISTTENAILDVMGGCRVLGPGDNATDTPETWSDFNAYIAAGATSVPFGATGWRLAIDPSRIGEGPKVDGKSSGAFFTAGSGVLGVTTGQVAAGLNPVSVPDLLDAWGQPIIYLRQIRSRGPLVSDVVADNSQFLTAGMASYLNSTGLGELNSNQVYGGSNPGGSVLTLSQPNALDNFGYLLRHAGLGSYALASFRQTSTARGAYMLLSAGPDGVFMSATDGPGSPGTPITDLPSQMDDPNNDDPTRLIEEYDDIRVYGGG